MGQTDLVSLVLAHSLQTGEVTTRNEGLNSHKGRCVCGAAEQHPKSGVIAYTIHPSCSVALRWLAGLRSTKGKLRWRQG